MYRVKLDTISMIVHTLSMQPCFSSEIYAEQVYKFKICISVLCACTRHSGGITHEHARPSRLPQIHGVSNFAGTRGRSRRRQGPPHVRTHRHRKLVRYVPRQHNFSSDQSPHFFGGHPQPRWNDALSTLLNDPGRPTPECQQQETSKTR